MCASSPNHRLLDGSILEKTLLAVKDYANTRKHFKPFINPVTLASCRHPVSSSHQRGSAFDYAIHYPVVPIPGGFGEAIV